ncbi:hypothetical protein SAMN04487866_105116 [Thermoactinomyces sp. DSM 45891]|nr:hypothetical protein SAMN04487866_105116 [Thermoactinomyces sp. DSM 45891]
MISELVRRKRIEYENLLLKGRDRLDFISERKSNLDSTLVKLESIKKD